MSAPAYSYQWPAVPSQLFTADGAAGGLVTLLSTRGFFTFQKVTISAATQPTIQLQVMEVISPTQLVLGTIGLSQYQTSPNVVNLTGYSVANGAAIVAAQQNKQVPTPNQVPQSLYVADPVVAHRVMPVDDQGFFMGTQIVAPQSLDMSANRQGATVDGRNFSAGSVSTTIVGTATGTLGVQVSNDGTNWIALPGFTPVAVSGAGTYGGSWTGNGFAFIRASYIFTSGTGSNPVTLVLKKV